MKKLATILALTAVVANLGIASVLAQTSPVTGTQDIGCPTVSNSFGTGTDAPANFQIGDDGVRSVSSTNDTSYVPADNSGYFDNDNDSSYNDATDTLTISSNIPYSCGANGSGIALSVAQTSRFETGAAEPLYTLGSDNAVGGTGAAEDYYPIFSVITSAAAACTSPCVLAQSSSESPSSALAGATNVFTNAGPNDKTMTTGDSNALLRNSSGVANTATLYMATYGLEGTVSIPGLDFSLMLPSNIETEGSYSSTVTYTLSVPAF